MLLVEREFVILPHFEEKWKKLGLTDDDLRILENEILKAPEQPAVIPGTGGIRKIRVKLPGIGKRGGARVLYVDFVHASKIYFLTAYAKSRQTDLIPLERKSLKRLVDILREEVMRTED